MVSYVFLPRFCSVYSELRLVLWCCELVVCGIVVHGVSRLSVVCVCTMKCSKIRSTNDEWRFFDAACRLMRMDILRVLCVQYSGWFDLGLTSSCLRARALYTPSSERVNFALGEWGALFSRWSRVSQWIHGVMYVIVSYAVKYTDGFSLRVVHRNSRFGWIVGIYQRWVWNSPLDRFSGLVLVQGFSVLSRVFEIEIFLQLKGFSAGSWGIIQLVDRF